MLNLAVGGIHAGSQVNGRGGQVRHAGIVAGNLEQIREQLLEAVQLPGHELGGALRARGQAIGLGFDEVCGHAHGGNGGAQLMRDIGSKLPLQIAVFLQLRNLGGQFIRHIIKGGGKSAHLIVPVHGHALLEMAGG